MIRIVIAVALLAARLELAKRHARREYIGRHSYEHLGLVA